MYWDELSCLCTVMNYPAYVKSNAGHGTLQSTNYFDFRRLYRFTKSIFQDGENGLNGLCVELK